MYRRTKSLVSSLVLVCSFGAFAKSIVVGERIIKKNPWRNGLIKRQYALAIQSALAEHRKRFPKSNVQIIQSIKTGEIQAFEAAKKSSSLGVVGYLYSTDSMEAAAMAKADHIFYIAPVTPLAQVNTEYSMTLATVHDGYLGKYESVKNLFPYRTIIVSTPTSMVNFEYANLCSKVFNVTETLSGSNAEIIKQLQGLLDGLKPQEKINLFFAGYSFEQIEILALLQKHAKFNQINMIGNGQWTYSPHIMREKLSPSVSNLYVVSDYFDQDEIIKFGDLGALQNKAKFESLKGLVGKKPIVKGHYLDEPILYVLKDMISIALLAAEKSSNRREFIHHMKNQKYEGASGTYHIRSGIPEKKVYLGKWNNSKMIPIKSL